MENFNHFSNLEIQVLRVELGKLMGTEDFQSRVLTGFNYYNKAIPSEKLVIAMSFLHRAKKLKEKVKEDLLSNRITKSLLLEERTDEIPFIRKKNAIYLSRPNFIIQRDPQTNKLDKNTIYFDFISGENVPIEIVEQSKYVKDILNQNSKYRHIGIKEINGFEISLNIKSKEEAKTVLKLLREKVYRFKMDKSGFPKYSQEGEEILNTRAYPLADAVPCIILGRDFETFIEESLNDFIKCQKLSLIKHDDEINALTHKTTIKLKKNSAFNVLKNKFGRQLREIPVYANNYLISTYIDRL